MAANTSPIYSRVGSIQWVSGYITAANTTTDLTSGTIYLAFTADATNGSWVEKIVFQPTPGGNTTKTVARIWINNGGSTGSSANNNLYDQITLPSVTADADDEVLSLERLLGISLDPAFTIYVTIHTGSANGWACTVIGGKY